LSYGIFVRGKSVQRLTYNGFGLGEVADLKAQMFNLLQMFISITNVQFSTEPAFFAKRLLVADNPLLIRTSA
jgi:hypothetical protein